MLMALLMHNSLLLVRCDDLLDHAVVPLHRHLVLPPPLVILGSLRESGVLVEAVINKRYLVAQNKRCDFIHQSRKWYGGLGFGDEEESVYLIHGEHELLIEGRREERGGGARMVQPGKQHRVGHGKVGC